MPNPTPILTNVNGHHTPKRRTSLPKKQQQPDKQSSCRIIRVLTVSLGALVVMTVLVDSYWLFSADFRLNREPEKIHLHPGTRAYVDKLLHRGHGSVTKAQRASVTEKTAWTKRKFKFQDGNNPLPTMKKQNSITGSSSGSSWNQQISSSSSFGKEPILKVFEQAGIPPLNASMIAQLPTWDQIVKVIGAHPVIGGLDTCQAYKDKVPAVERMLGSSGMFNTGTNLVTHLLKNNCKIPERVEKYGAEASREMHGMRWQVPWGKHSPAKYKEEHSTRQAKAINKEWIMPVVTMRHPYSWMHSMCKNGYTARWNHGRRGNNCPNLIENGKWNQVTTKFADGRAEESDSLAHLWNDWYKMYLEDAKYPRLFVRLEDLVFHAQESTRTICECVGGKIRTDRPFTYVLDSAKADSRGHDTSTGFIQAWIKYSNPMPPRGGFTPSDYRAAKEALNTEYMKMFHYEHPPSG